MQTILISGGAGFIGSNLAERLLKDGYRVIVVDNFDEYYAPAIKQNNISFALTHPHFTFINSDICNLEFLQNILPANIFAFIHLAAKAGVRNSIINPNGYEEENIKGITKALELAVKLNIKKFIFSSSSSIYGNSKFTPFREDQTDLNPINPYAKSKLLSEQIGRKISEQHDITFVALRFFSVYGPRLRPDLVMNKIADNLSLNQPLKIFGNGDALRDYTYIDDITGGIIKSLNYNDKRFDIINLGSGNPISLLDVIGIFERYIGRKVKLEFTNVIKGESDITWADNSKAKLLLNFTPTTDINSGIKKYLDWFKLRGLS